MTTTTAPAPAATGTGGGQFAGTGRLVRLALRRDRIRVPAWAGLFAMLATASYSATAGLYPDPALRRPAAEIFNTAPSLVAMFGRVYDPNSLGALATIKLVAFYGAAIAIVMVFHVVRHTRADEDAGRVELLSSTVVGRLAPLAAALVSAVVLAGAIGVAAALAMTGAGAPAGGSAAFGLAWAMMGLSYGMVTAILAQIVPEARPVIGMGVAAVGLGYLLRALGDLQTPSPGIASWLSPIGWGQQLRPYAGDRFAFALLPLAASAVLAGGAMWLRGRRDLGSGMIPERAGAPGTSMSSPLALALRLNRGLLLGWAAGLALMGLVVGSIANSMGGFFDDPKMLVILEALGGRKGLVDMFLSVEISLVTAFVAAAGISVISHLRREEENGRTEVVLSGPTSRITWAGASLAVAIVGVAALILVVGLSVGAGAAIAMHDVSQVSRVILAAAARIPAAWVLVGIAMVLYGFVPRLVALSWLALLGFLVLGDFATLWGLPDWVASLSPFAHSPNLPGGHFAILPVLGLTLVAVGLSALGMVGWARRDLMQQ